MFPGQGCQTPGMGRQLIADFQLARDVLQQASELYGDDLNAIRMRGPAERLAQPAVAELLIAAMQISYAALMKDAHLIPDVVAGYSAGEVAAFYACDALSRNDALQAAAIRGRVLNQWTCAASRMISVSRIPATRVEQILAQAESTVEIACRNSANHVAVVGDEEAIRQIDRILIREGATTSPINVAGPWHSRTIQAAADLIETLLQPLPFHPPQIPLYLSATGQLAGDGKSLRHHLAAQVALPVLWQPIVDAWKQSSVTKLIEVGSGRHLQGILRAAWPHIDQYQVECLETTTGRIAPLIRLLNSSRSKV